jgi:hypothetical protein
MKTLTQVYQLIRNAKFGTEFLFVNIQWQKYPRLHTHDVDDRQERNKTSASVGIFKIRFQMCSIQVHKLLSCFNDAASAAVFRRLMMI